MAGTGWRLHISDSLDNKTGLPMPPVEYTSLSRTTENYINNKEDWLQSWIYKKLIYNCMCCSVKVRPMKIMVLKKNHLYLE